MNRYALAHLDDHVLLRDLVAHVTRNCAATADLLAHLAEVDARKLYLPAARPSMHSYCVQVLGLSEDAASKRIHVARKAREFPAVFSAIADGRLHLSGAVLLAPHLTRENAEDLLAAAERKTKSDIEALLAQRFPKPDLPTRIARVASASPSILESPAPSLAAQHAPGHVEAPRPRVTPLAPERFSVQFTVGEDTYETLRYVQALLGHQVPSGDVAQVFDRALRALMADLERARFAATARPRAGRQRASTNPRHIPAHVKRAVWLRDGGQCGFVSDNGTRCPERSRLEFDHTVEVARGGEATLDGIRLRCRAHNQYEAERTFGAGFMQLKRDAAQREAAGRRATVAMLETEPLHETTPEPVREAAERRATMAMPQPQHDPAPEPLRAAAERRATAAQPELEPQPHHEPQLQHEPFPEPVRASSIDHEVDRDLLHCLKGLGWRADAARFALEISRGNPEASIEERLHAALKFLGARGRTHALRQAVIHRSGAAGFAPSRRAAP